MRQVFVDTAAWIALLDEDDSLHPSAIRVWDLLRREGGELVTTDFVLVELADALSSPSQRLHTVSFIVGLRASKKVEVVAASSSALAAGWSLYARRQDKEWGLTDCISFTVMTDRKTSDAFTSDHHFEQAGFVKLLES